MQIDSVLLWRSALYFDHDVKKGDSDLPPIYKEADDIYRLCKTHCPSLFSPSHDNRPRHMQVVLLYTKQRNGILYNLNFF